MQSGNVLNVLKQPWVRYLEGDKIPIKSGWDGSGSGQDGSLEKLNAFIFSEFPRSKLFEYQLICQSGNSHHFQTHQLFRMNLRGLGAELAPDLVVAVAGSFDVRQQLGWLLEFLQRINDVKLCSYCFLPNLCILCLFCPKQHS